MNQLKEKREERSKEESKEKPLLPPRAREASVFGDLDSVQHAWERGILIRDLESMRQKLGTSVEVINGWLSYMEQVDWRFSDGEPVSRITFRRSLRMWVKFEREYGDRRGRGRGVESAQPKRESEAEKREKLAKIAADPKSWTLCEERCEHWRGGRCSRGVTVPPMHNPHPHPPEECPRYAAKRGEAAR